MSIPSILHLAYQSALKAHCDNPKSVPALDRLIRVRDIQSRASKHYRSPRILGCRSVALAA